MPVAAVNLTVWVMHGLLLPLGLSARSERATNHVWFYLAMLMACAVVIVGLGLVARKYLAGPVESSKNRAKFDLSDLRRMHREGELSDDEYLAARAVALADSGVYLDDTAATANPSAIASNNPGVPGSTSKPPNRSGVELGPELMDDPQAPPQPPAPPDDSDNPDQAPPTDGPI